MNTKKKHIVGALLIASILALIWALLAHVDLLALLKDYVYTLKRYTDQYYLLAVLAFIATYITVVLLFLPLPAMLTLLAGFLFGVVWGTLYVIIGATLGAIGSFLLVRYFFGDWLQERYKTRLEAFNEHLAQGQTSYLLAIHLVAVVPFSVVNILAGLTKVPLWTFIWTTSLGIIPVSCAYAFAGRQLSRVHSLQDILSKEVVLTFIFLGLVSLLPIAVRWLRSRRS